MVWYCDGTADSTLEIAQHAYTLAACRQAMAYPWMQGTVDAGAGLYWMVEQYARKHCRYGRGNSLYGVQASTMDRLRLADVNGARS
jgi:hypothetical protein